MSNALGGEASPQEKDGELQARSLSTVVRGRSDGTTVAARLGPLAELGWVAFPVVGLRCHREMGLAYGDVLLAIGLLASYRERDEWPSLAQEQLARRLGASRTTIAGRVRKLRRIGFLATRERPVGNRFGLPRFMLFYCLEPYLAVLSAWAAKLPETDDELARYLEADAEARLDDFLAAVAASEWDWTVGSLSTAAGVHLDELSAAFLARYGLHSRHASPMLGRSTQVEASLTDNSLVVKQRKTSPVLN